MFKFYCNGKYGRTSYQSQAVACDQAKLYSAIHQVETCVVDMNTGEVLEIYRYGLLAQD